MADVSYPGRGLGLPPSGPGSIASFGRRLAALAIDWWLSLLIVTGLLRAGAEWTPAVLAVEYVLLVTTLGMTVGMRLLGIRVVNLYGTRPPRWPAVVVRTALLMLVVPAVVYDKDRRGLHDRAAGTAVIRT